MKPIKFRGKNLDTGELVYSKSIMQEEGEKFYRYKGVKAVWFEGREKNYPVDAESVSQLVGYDSEGTEIYDGDYLVDSDGKTAKAELEVILGDHEYCFPAQFKRRVGNRE